MFGAVGWRALTRIIGRADTGAFMKSKQLAKVLIKIVGLFLCAQGAMHIATGILDVLASRVVSGAPLLWSNFLGGLVLVAIGFFFIAGGQSIATSLFKGEDE
jgi:hypothetical protein